MDSTRGVPKRVLLFEARLDRLPVFFMRTCCGNAFVVATRRIDGAGVSQVFASKLFENSDIDATYVHHIGGIRSRIAGKDGTPICSGNVKTKPKNDDHRRGRTCNLLITYRSQTRCHFARRPYVSGDLNTPRSAATTPALFVCRQAVQRRGMWWRLLVLADESSQICVPF